MFQSKKLAEALFQMSKRDQEGEMLKNFFHFLKKKNLLYYLPQIKKHLQRLHREDEERETLFIRSLYQLSEKDIDEIRNLIGISREIPVHFEKDAKILGGFSARYGEHRYSGSLQDKLKQFEAHLKK